ncbi:Fe-S oxidoreductase [Kitasatospora herbaricolor]|uniref:(Fe-S)-binding protein n=1 Tax=Kitasatospora herbaricolor TaxID=68217 RepID=UPI00174C253F|nr:(Fe-S)-binding protein [Kitasatospora herbaricolor]MDQ0305630.1 L-lactate dehydrogenase complex protein LldE [Kitasatospora herbaricolor]GGV45475.1 Fe-S oxidoreductase [Kitasatospora herbaricolor]
MRIALFVTCFNDTLYPSTGRAVVRVLERLGHCVDFPQEQTCCGQMHFNTGYRSAALPLVRRFADTFAEYDAVVTPSASCAGMVRDNHPALAERYAPPALQQQIAELAPKVHEFTEFLTDVLGVTDVGAHFPHKVAYHPTCHSLRGLRLGDRPERLLRAVHGLELLHLRAPEECCGFGGTFAMKNADTSAAILADKTADVTATAPDVLCAADNSCLLQIGGGLSQQGSDVRTLHLAEILAATEGDPR